MHPHTTAPDTQYADDRHLRARQALWSRLEPDVPLIPWVLDLAQLDGPEAVLDAGCGNGAYLTGLTERGHAGRVVGLDLSRGMLAAVGPAAALVQADVQSLPLATSAVDLALAPHVLHHVPDRARATAELRRVVRPGGRCLAVTNGTENLVQLQTVVEGAVGGGWRWHRPAEDVFSLQNGAEQLATAFEQVERFDLHREVIVTDPEVIAGYVASVRDHYEAQLPPGRWDGVIDEARRWAVEAITAGGELRLSTAMGAFVCR